MSNNTFNKQIEHLLSKMTIEEKISLLSGKGSWKTMDIERLGIPSLVMTDGPYGVRCCDLADKDRIVGPATCFPTGISMASTWNTDLIERVGATLAEETRALGCDILLGPCINIIRVPQAGRNFETYSEDPFLAGKIGTAFVRGLQKRGIGTSLKHYACNNQEYERMRGSSIVDERTLREIYLAAFEMIVKQANPWTVMCSYNRLNGTYASENYHLLREILKQEWGYDGLVISDWGANHTIIESIKGGLDIEMDGQVKYFGDFLKEAVNNWQIDESLINESVRRILDLLFKSGKMEATTNPPAGALNTEAHKNLAREIAEESITLLKNEDDLLPLNKERVQSIAVIGPNADDAPVGGGGSSYVEPSYKVSPLEGLKRLLADSVKIHYAKGCDNYVELPLIKKEILFPAKEDENGLFAQYFNTTDFSGKVIAEEVTSRFDQRMFRPPGPVSRDTFSVQWTGKLKASQTGRHIFKLCSSGIARLYINGKQFIKTALKLEFPHWPVSESSFYYDFEEGKLYDIKIEYIHTREVKFNHLNLRFAYAPLPEDDNRIQEAVKLAQNTDIAIIFAGMPAKYESEGFDRPNIELPGRQNELITNIASVNKKTIVVLNNGSPVTMPWIDKIPCVLEAFYPGQEGGNAVAKILFGMINPSGKLSITYPQKIEDNPSFINYPGDREVRYGEGIFVGYRYYDKKLIDPLFPFGHGLSYTQFEYTDIKAPSEIKQGESTTISLRVKNSGRSEGKEVVQLYVHDVESTLLRPPKELKGFKKIHLNTGENKTISFVLDDRAFSYYDPNKHKWVMEEGKFEILIGTSSQDIRIKTRIQCSSKCT